jgi:Holliday junction resolvasome RuvABC endonuclease subunit
MAIDPSLTCSGWAIFSVHSGKLLGVGKIRSLPPSVAFGSRIADLQQKISSVFEHLKLCLNDVLVCEAPTTMRDPRAAFKVEQVRGMFETLARGRSVEVPGRLNPRSVQYEVIGLRGRQRVRVDVKNAAVQVVEALYGRELGELGFAEVSDELKKHQDIVDAILIGSLGLSRLRAAETAKTGLAEFFDREGNTRRSGSALWKRRMAAQ